jgi:glycosyltransferase involved in cell wall biosynthesis
MTDRVLVVVPLFNCENFIGDCISSVISQHHENWRCVIVDDGSTDRSYDVAVASCATDPRFLLVQQANAGVSKAREAGLAHRSDEQLVLFLDSDDLLLPTALAELVGALGADPTLVGASGWAELIDEHGTLIPGEHPPVQRTRVHAPSAFRVERRSLAQPTTFDDLCVYGPLWPPCTVLLRWEALARAGSFAEDVGTQEDWDLFLRMSVHGNFAFLDRQVALYRRHTGNRSRDDAQLARFRATVRFRNFHNPDLTSEQRRTARRSLRALQLSGSRHQLAQVKSAVLARRPLAILDALLGALYLTLGFLSTRMPKPRRVSGREAKWLQSLDISINAAIGQTQAERLGETAPHV